MQIPLIGKLIKEDFAQQFQDMIGKLGFIVNPAFSNIQSVLTNGITLEDNVNCVIKIITVAIDKNGTPTSSIAFPTGLTSKISHLIVTLAVNQTNSSVYPTGAPWVSFTQNNNIITVNNITGLPVNNTFALTLVGLI